MRAEHKNALEVAEQLRHLAAREGGPALRIFAHLVVGVSLLCTGELVEALRKQDVRRLVAVPGVGKKTAERMVLELAEKAQKFSEPAPQGTPPTVAADDVISALVNLGYRKNEAERAIDGIARAGAPADFGDYLKAALKKLTGG